MIPHGDLLWWLLWMALTPFITAAIWCGGQAVWRWVRRRVRYANRRMAALQGR